MKRTALVLALAVLGSGPTPAADPATIDWGKIPAVTVPLFYPGQSSYEWLVSDAHKGAVKEVRRGDACAFCHDEPDAEKDIGEKIVAGKRLEPNPPKGKNGHIDLKVQAAFDDRNAYLRFQWKTNGGRAGTDHPAYRFDGKQWKPWGGARLDADVQAGRQRAIYEDRLSLMIDDGKVPNFAKQGCWLTCHNGSNDMPQQATRDEVAANALLAALKKSDVRKYLPASRNDPADWKSGKTPEEIAKLKAEGGFVDLIQWLAHRSNPVGGVDDGYVLEYRNFDAGKNHFASNLDEKKQPKFMFDAAKRGSRSLTANDFGKKDNILIKGVNAVPFDPNAGWKDGDLLPQYVLSAADAAGSAADNKGSGVWKDGMWTVVIIRPLNLANADDKALRPGSVYNVGFAVHDDNMTSRGHHVGWVRSLGLGVKADIEAVRLP
jgi:hypothetical protein